MKRILLIAFAQALSFSLSAEEFCPHSAEHLPDFIQFSKEQAKGKPCPIPLPDPSKPVAQYSTNTCSPPIVDGTKAQGKNLAGKLVKQPSKSLSYQDLQTPNISGDGMKMGATTQLKYTVYRYAPNPSPRKTIIVMCGGPERCTKFNVPPNIPPGYDVILYDYPGIGENENGTDRSEHSSQGAAKMAAAIVKKEGLLNYTFYGFSFGTSIATIATTKLAGSISKPKLLFDSTVTDFDPSPPSVPEPKILSKEGKDLYNGLQKSLKEGGSLYQTILNMFFLERNDDFMKRFSRLSKEEAMACLSNYVDGFVRVNANPGKDAVDKFKSVAFCEVGFKLSEFPIPDEIPITYISPSNEKKGAEAHCSQQTKDQALKQIVIFKDWGHAGFSQNGPSKGCEREKKIWSGVFNPGQKILNGQKCGPSSKSQTNSAPSQR